MWNAERQSGRCCFVLNLRLGAVIIGIVNSIFYIFLFSWYLVNHETLTGSRLGESNAHLTSMNIFMFLSFFLLMIVNTLLIVGSVRKLPSHLLPWLCVTGSIIIIAILILFTVILFGNKLLVDVKLTKYLIILIVSAFAIGLDFFFWIAVFVLWRNVSEESETQTEVFVRSKEESASRPPPPRYADLQTEDPPPEYEAAMRMQGSSNKKQ